MTLLAPKASEIYSIGTIIEANVPPSGKWLPCQGQVLAQFDYPALYGIMDNPYPMLFSDWEFCDDFDTGGDTPYCERVQWNQNTGSPIWLALAGDSNYGRTTDGITWTMYSMPSTGSWYCGFGNSIFCAVKYGSTSGATSSNGFTWSTRALPYAYNWSNVVWDGTYFIATASNNVQVIRSTDGITWGDAGVLPKTGFYYAASDRAGTVVVIDGGNEIVCSDDGGMTWTYIQGAQGSWYSIEYCNGYFLISTNRSYVGVSSDGLDWEWIPYYSDTLEGFDGELNVNAAQIWKWRYFAGIYFGVGKDSPFGLYSFDLRTFHVWFNNPQFAEMYDVIYNSTSGNLTVYGGYTYSMPYSQITGRYDDSTHFQLPNYFKHKFYNYGKSRYIRVL
jgi:hypothetical protein